MSHPPKQERVNVTLVKSGELYQLVNGFRNLFIPDRLKTHLVGTEKIRVDYSVALEKIAQIATECQKRDIRLERILFHSESLFDMMVLKSSEEEESLVSPTKVDALKALVSAGFDVNLDAVVRLDSGDFTPLQRAASFSTPKICETLLECGARIDDTTQEGYSALHFAVRNQRVGNTTCLLQCGANPNIRTAAGVAPILSACRRGGVEILNVLLEHGASKLVVDRSGQTLMHYAAIYSEVDILNLLIREGIPTNISDFAGDLPIHLAVYHDNLPAIKALVAAGSPLEYEGKSFFQIAQEMHIEKGTSIGFKDSATFNYLKGIDLAMTEHQELASLTAPKLSNPSSNHPVDKKEQRTRKASRI